MMGWWQDAEAFATLGAARDSATAETYAVPRGRSRASAVGTWVRMPTSAQTRPSSTQAIARFSAGQAPWMSRRIRSAIRATNES